MRKSELDAPSLKSMEGHLQANMEVCVDNNKSPGPDDITTEMRVAVGDIKMTELTKLANMMYVQGTNFVVWCENTGLIVCSAVV